MRVLQAVDCYPPPLIGGRDLHVQMLSHELVRRGHEVEVVTLAGSAGDRTDMDGAVPVHRMAGWSRALSHFYEDPDRPWHPTVPDPGMVRSIGKLIERLKPDVVHAHSWIVHSLLPLLPTKQTRLVVTMHEYGLVCPKNTFVYRGGVCAGPRFPKCVACASHQYGGVRSAALTTGLTLSRRLLRRVDRFIAVSEPVAQACARLVVGGQRNITVIPPFLLDDSLGHVAGSRPSFVPATGDYVMFAGGVGPHKGLDVLLEAHEQLDQDVPLVVVGLGDRNSLKRRSGGVMMAYNMPHDEVLRAWANCALAVVPSRWPEPFGLVALEAMAAGRPVIASAVGGLPDLVRDGETGVLVPPGDPRALRIAIAGLLGDPSRRARLGEAGRQRAASYTASAVVPRIEDVYREALASPLPRPSLGVRHVFR